MDIVGLRSFVLIFSNSMFVTVELIFCGNQGPVVFMNHVSDVGYIILA